MTVHDIVLCKLQLHFCNIIAAFVFIHILLKSCTFMKFKSPCMYCVDDENEMHIKYVAIRPGKPRI